VISDPVHKVTTLIRNLTALLLFAMAASLGAQEPRPAATPSVVYYAQDPDAIRDYHVDGRAVHLMVDRLVMSVTGAPDVAKAWQALVAPNDKVGIKISAAGGQLFTTHREVVEAIVDGLVAAGHPRSSIIVWDRSISGIKNAGYRPGAEGFQLREIAPKEGYDEKAVISAPLLGTLVWGDLEYHGELGRLEPLSDVENTSSVSHVARILANDVTKVINVPVMSNTEMNGIAGCLYNMTIPNIDNWRRFTQGRGFGAGSIAEIYANPFFGKKVALNIVDGLVAQYAGGPQSQPLYSEHHATLYASKDPVALDAIVLQKLEEWRTRGKLPAIGHMAAYVEAASYGGLGNASRDRIELKSVGRVTPK
jgi:uncharacterized protein (DUF362 family)